MKFSLLSEDFEDEQGLPLTSLIDIVFLLLIFYLSVSRIEQMDAQLAVKLPTAKSAEQPERAIGDVVVNVLESGEVIVNNQTLELTDLETRLSRLAELWPGQSVIIRSDKGATWEQVSAVLDTCSVADIWNIKFAVSTPESPSP